MPPLSPRSARRMIGRGCAEHAGYFCLHAAVGRLAPPPRSSAPRPAPHRRRRRRPGWRARRDLGARLTARTAARSASAPRRAVVGVALRGAAAASRRGAAAELAGGAVADVGRIRTDRHRLHAPGLLRRRRPAVAAAPAAPRPAGANAAGAGRPARGRRRQCDRLLLARHHPFGRGGRRADAILERLARAVGSAAGGGTILVGAVSRLDHRRGRRRARARRESAIAERAGGADHRKAEHGRDRQHQAAAPAIGRALLALLRRHVAVFGVVGCPGRKSPAVGGVTPIAVVTGRILILRVIGLHGTVGRRFGRAGRWLRGLLVACGSGRGILPMVAAPAVRMAQARGVVFARRAAAVAGLVALRCGAQDAPSHSGAGRPSVCEPHRAASRGARPARCSANGSLCPIRRASSASGSLGRVCAAYRRIRVVGRELRSLACSSAILILPPVPLTRTR